MHPCPSFFHGGEPTPMGTPLPGIVGRIGTQPPGKKEQKLDGPEPEPEPEPMPPAKPGLGMNPPTPPMPPRKF